MNFKGVVLTVNYPDDECEAALPSGNDLRADDRVPAETLRDRTGHDLDLS